MKISELLHEAQEQPKKRVSKPTSALPTAPSAASIDNKQSSTKSKKIVTKNEYDVEGFNQQGVNRWGATREEAEDYEITGDLATDNKIWMTMGEMNGLYDFANNQPYDFSAAVEKICDIEQIGEIISDLTEHDYYFAYTDLVSDLQKIILEKTGDNSIWIKIVGINIIEIINVPQDLLQNNQFAIDVIDAAKEFTGWADKHYLRTGVLEDYDNDANKLMKSWGSSVALSPRVKKYLNDLVRQKMFSVSWN